MAKHEHLEKIIIAALALSLVAGLAVSAVKKSLRAQKISVGKFDSASRKSSNTSDFLFEDKININCAKVEDLMKIKGIGKTIAKRIVEYRYYNGSYASIDDIKNIKGVSVSLFERIKNRISTE